MKDFKRIALLLLSVVLVIGMLFTVSACNGNTEPTDDGENEENQGNNNENAGGTEDEENKLPDGQAEYTVLILDGTGAPVSGVGVQLCSDAGCQMPNATDATGKVTFITAEDDYKVQIANVPSGYINPGSEKKFNLINNSAIITVDKAASFVITVNDQFGNPVKDAQVTHTGAPEAINTSSAGVAVFDCKDGEGYKAFVVAPAGYEPSNAVYSFADGVKSLTVTLNKITEVTVIVKNSESQNMAGAIVAVVNKTTGEVVGYAKSANNGVARISVVMDATAQYEACLIYLEGYTAAAAEIDGDGYATVIVSAKA